MEDYEELLEKGLEETEDIEQGERFELPVADTRKDGSKTIITNFSEIAETIKRDEKHFSKYIQNELGTAGHVEGDEMVLNGEFRRGNVQAKVKQYAEEYVYCDECGKADTEITKEKGVEMMKCQACGARNPV
ncbi:MAG: translation initiation factor IF-2 subunit beta [Candidatus Nanohaloarchaea archaeon]